MPYFVLCYDVCSREGGSPPDSSVQTERVQEQKEKMQAELQALWREQADQLKKKKEQFATEVRQIKIETPLRDCILFKICKIHCWIKVTKCKK